MTIVQLLRPWLGTGLLLGAINSWRRHRMLNLKPFHQARFASLSRPRQVLLPTSSAG